MNFTMYKEKRGSKEAKIKLTSYMETQREKREYKQTPSFLLLLRPYAAGMRPT